MNEELPLFPVTGWDIAPIAAYDAIMIRLAFLAHATQTPAEADPGRRYVLNRAQARELMEAIGRTLHRLETGAPQGTGLPKH